VRPHWLGTLLYLPLLVAAGWLTVQPLGLLAPALRPDQLSLLGTVLAFALLLITLPVRLRRVWGEQRPWQRLGIAAPVDQGFRALLGGLILALLLLALVTGGLLLLGQARWRGVVSSPVLLNAAALLGVGFAEELVFRGWLWGELELLIGTRRALLGQALLFSVVHTRFNLGPLASLALLGGLALLGLVLALQRRADHGNLAGAVGLHGGLVGGWFALVSGLIELSPTASAWWVGPGGASPNPIGGVLGWLGLGVLLALRALARRRDPD
jgi:membrane protease YdiL (CAAX protease family)